MIHTIPASCPYCGEPVEVDVDASGGERQSYVEDCTVCCRPWQVEVEHVHDDEWHVELLTADD